MGIVSHAAKWSVLLSALWPLQCRPREMNPRDRLPGPQNGDHPDRAEFASVALGRRRSPSGLGNCPLASEPHVVDGCLSTSSPCLF
ncbi:uncharacterized protein BDW47DRAFT_106762 [Aspergillus candidus]|uniref:Secreted protein n=1 Tax=Aspergillus candidus TaxID=41067 RepID=A0A2I2FA54_ASPCN|nr:hypothetical protein BDW47DRAFT_106762 [Aspergillus candidus]PLB37510.1 hypothetical protein BDW47DRAFT_106762 [Aspergillus candidus]